MNLAKADYVKYLAWCVILHDIHVICGFFKPLNKVA